MPYYAGYHRSRIAVLQYDRQQCIELIESLYGWNWGEDGVEVVGFDPSTEVLREEALRQHRQE